MSLDEKTDAYRHVGQQMRLLRLERGLTQAQAAQIISVSPQQYQKYEDAQSKCSLNYLIALADHYGVSVNVFLPGGEATSVPANASQASPEAIGREADLLARLVSAFVSLEGAGEKLRFVQLVEAIATSQKEKGE